MKSLHFSASNSGDKNHKGEGSTHLIKYEKCGGKASIAFELRLMILLLAKYEIVILEVFSFLFRLQKITFEVVVVSAPARAQDYPNPSRSSPRSIPNEVSESIQKLL